MDRAVARDIQRRMKALNETISQSSVLGEQYQIGHSYVIPQNKLDAGDKQTAAKQWFKRVAKTEIHPLLEEYWFDSPKELGEAWDAFTKVSDVFSDESFSSL